MLSFFKAFLPAPTVRSLVALQQLLDREAAHLAQKSVIDFARNELGSLSAQAFDDQRFLDKLAVCRWEGFAATLADMIVLAYAQLLEGGVTKQVLDARLGDLYATILTGHPRPDHRTQGWDAEIAALRKRLAGAANPQAYAAATGALVFNTLPVPPRDPV